MMKLLFAAVMTSQSLAMDHFFDVKGMLKEQPCHKQRSTAGMTSEQVGRWITERRAQAAAASEDKSAPTGVAARSSGAAASTSGVPRRSVEFAVQDVLKKHRGTAGRPRRTGRPVARQASAGLSQKEIGKRLTNMQGFQAASDSQSAGIPSRVSTAKGHTGQKRKMRRVGRRSRTLRPEEIGQILSKNFRASNPPEQKTRKVKTVRFE